MNKNIETALDKIIHGVKFRPAQTASPLSYKVISPLTNIGLAIEMVESRNTDPDIKLYVEIIKRNCAAVHQLINENSPVDIPFVLRERTLFIKKTLSQDY